MEAIDHGGARVRALRERIGLSQEKLAEQAQVSRVEVVRVEGGHNKMTSHRMRSGLASALGLTPEQFDALLRGELSVDDAFVAATQAKTGTYS